MNKIWFVIKREYKTRVVKKSFIIMSIIGPLFFAALVIAPAYFSSLQENKLRKIAVIDQTGIYDDTLINTSLLNNLKLKEEKVDINKVMYRRLPDTKYIHFDFLPSTTSIDSVQKHFKNTEYYALLFIPENLIVSNTIQLYSDKDIALNIKMYLSNFFKNEIEKEKLKSHNIDPNIIKSVETKIRIDTIKWTKKGEVKSFASEIAMVLGFLASFLIYFFIFMYSSMVIRGVIEEKTNRIIEIIVSSVRSTQLMIGKIIGVALVGLTQFLLWVILSSVIITFAKQSDIFNTKPTINNPKTISSLLNDTTTTVELLPSAAEKENLSEVVSQIQTTVGAINWPVVILSFIVFFLGGYLLYSSIFAAIGAMVDNETDTQQFTLPVTIPMLISIVMIQSFVNYPDSQVSVWFSIIPFTSPIAMMARIPFGVPYWQLLLSIALLSITIYFTIIFSAKIYRVGILTYGKKPSYRDLIRWFKLKL